MVECFFLVVVWMLNSGLVFHTKGIRAKRQKGKRETNLVGGVAGRDGKGKTCAVLTCA